jgi:hypothetical protein
MTTESGIDERILLFGKTSEGIILPVLYNLYGEITTWLSGFSNRLAITISPDNIDDTLTDYPVKIWLSESSGINTADLSSVFNKLGSDANRKKIAVTTSDGLTQCYVEIANWDTENKQAELHVRVPSVSSSASTVIYLYYDADHADNDSYVGDTASTPAKAVWDANFSAVYHMNDGADTSHIYDSTSNVNHGTKLAANEPLEVDGLKGKAQEFDTTDDIINIPDSSLWHLSTNDFCIEVSVNFKELLDGGIHTFLNQFQDANNYANFYIYNPSNVPYLGIHYRSAGATIYDHNTQCNPAISTDNWYNFIYSRSSGVLKLYQDSVELFSGVCTTNFPDYSTLLRIGNSAYHNKLIGEIRISSIVRSATWIKATNYNLRDELVTFGAAEEIITPSGVVGPKTLFGIDERVALYGRTLTGDVYPLAIDSTGKISVEYI